MSSFADGIAMGQADRARADASRARGIANYNADLADRNAQYATEAREARASEFNEKQAYRAALNDALADVVNAESSGRRFADALFRLGMRRVGVMTGGFASAAEEVAAMDLRYRHLTEAIRDNLTSQEQKLAMKREMEELRKQFPDARAKRDAALAKANKTIHDNLLALKLLPEQRMEIEAGYNALSDLVAKHPELQAEAEALRARHTETLRKREEAVAAQNAESDAKARAAYDADIASYVEGLAGRSIDAGRQAAAGLTVSGPVMRSNDRLLPERQIPPARIDDPERVFPPEPDPEPESESLGSRIMGFFK